MAGGVLIALLVIGALMLMFNNLSTYQNIGTQDVREAQIIEFNSQWSTYNRKDVRGSELYSLANKVVDYNRRKTTLGTGQEDEGQYIGYLPIEITIDVSENKKAFLAEEDKAPLLIKENTYVQSDTQKKFENELKKGIEEAESKLRRRN